MSATCKTCRFWLRHKSSTMGHCHRYPPVVFAEYTPPAEGFGGWSEARTVAQTAWPATDETEGCGEHQAPQPMSEPRIYACPSCRSTEVDAVPWLLWDRIPTISIRCRSCGLIDGQKPIAEWRQGSDSNLQGGGDDSG